MDPQANLAAILKSPSYLLAELDTELLTRPEMRPVRMQLELQKPELAFQEHGIRSTIVVFGSTRILEPSAAAERLAEAKAALAADPKRPLLARALARAEALAAKSRFYEEARAFARLVAGDCKQSQPAEFVVVTGGGPGIMEAANRGAADVGEKSVGLNITLPAEQRPNAYITPELCFQFHYFALRKMHFMLRAKALVVFPGGFGTLDELTDALTLRQTNRMQQIPIILYGGEYWRNVIDWQFLADQGVIEDEHLNLISYANAPDEAWQMIRQYYQERAAASAPASAPTGIVEQRP